jgi:hypothetical protein
MEGIPQGLKPLFPFPLERPKAEALGYLEAAARARASARQKANSKQQTADPYGMTRRKGNGNGNGKCNSKCRSRSLRDDNQKNRVKG